MIDNAMPRFPLTRSVIVSSEKRCTVLTLHQPWSMPAHIRLVEDVDYDNFKNAVAKRQGRTRSDLYHDVWSVLYRLQKPRQ